MADSQITLGLKVITTQREIAKNILDGIVDEVNARVNKVIHGLTDTFKILLREEIEAAPEYDSIVNGLLRTELGIENDPSSTLQSIVAHITNHAKIDFNTAKVFNSSHAFGSLTVKIDTDVDGIIAAVGGSYETEKGTTIPWLEWMLKLGDEIIVRDFHIVFNRPAYSRTNDAIMLKGGGWRVPPQYSGDEDNNFITRAIDRALARFQGEFSKAFKNI